MANIVVTGDTVTIQLSAMEKIEAAHGSLTIPRSAIASAQAVPDGMAEVSGFKLAGSGIPGVIEAGTFRGPQGHILAVCHGRKPAVVLHLSGQHFDRVIVTVDNPEEIVAALG